MQLRARGMGVRSRSGQKGVILLSEYDLLREPRGGCLFVKKTVMAESERGRSREGPQEA